MKRMLFNATQSEELRVAIVDGQKLLDLDIESYGKEQRKGNIYKGAVTRIEPSLEAAFVDYGAERHGFLPFKEVSRSYFANPQADPAKVRIQQALKEGQEVLVQVDKDERGNKGAALTTFIGLAGRYLVLMPNNPRGGGVSRRIEGEERHELRELISALEIPAGMSVIARTAGIGRSKNELEWDLNYLVQLWNAISSASEQQPASFLIYQESSLVIRAIRDHFHQDIGELLIDTDPIFDQATQFMSHVMPNNVNRVKKYNDDVPLFSRFQIEHQIESAYSRDVMLPSGGAIIIDHTEAIVAIDVNSAKSTRGSDIEETAFRTNLEAAEEITKQLRLRDLGGLVVIDFIDMESSKNQREVENFLRTSLSHDRARVQVGKISQFGLLELSRQRLNSSLGEMNYVICPQCSGIGNIRSTESTALHILRILQDEAMKENTATIQAQVPVDVATYLLNEKRDEFHELETRLQISCLLIPNTSLQVPHYEITRLKHDDQVATTSSLTPSYKMVSDLKRNKFELTKKTPDNSKAPEAIIKGIPAGKPAPTSQKKGFLSRLFGIFKSFTSNEKKSKNKSRKGRGKFNRQKKDRRLDRRSDRANRDFKRREKDGKDNKKDKIKDSRRTQKPRRSASANYDSKTEDQGITGQVDQKNKRRRRRTKNNTVESSSNYEEIASNNVSTPTKGDRESDVMRETNNMANKAETPSVPENILSTASIDENNANLSESKIAMTTSATKFVVDDTLPSIIDQSKKETDKPTEVTNPSPTFILPPEMQMVETKSSAENKVDEAVKAEIDSGSKKIIDKVEESIESSPKNDKEPLEPLQQIETKSEKTNKVEPH